MTGVMQAVAAGGSPLAHPIAVLADTKTGANAQCVLTLQTNGAITVTGSGSSCVPPNWYLPVTTGVGSRYWAKATSTGGDPINSGSAANTVLPLSATAGWGMIRTTVGTFSGTITVAIYADAGGAALVSSFSFQATATRN